jgi:hypothetical protein
MGLVGATWLASSTVGSWAAVKDNPYEMIVTRNAFALKPTPPDTGPPPPPPPPAVEVLLTGISTLGGAKKVLLQITDKTPGKKAEFPPPLVEGDIQGRVEIVSIDPDKGLVVVKIDGTEKPLTFEKDAPRTSGVPSSIPPPIPGPRVAGTMPLSPPPLPPQGAPGELTNAPSGPSGKFGVLVGGGNAGNSGAQPMPATSLAGGATLHQATNWPAGVLSPTPTRLYGRR